MAFSELSLLIRVCIQTDPLPDHPPLPPKETTMNDSHAQQLIYQVTRINENLQQVVQALRQLAAASKSDLPKKD